MSLLGAIEYNAKGSKKCPSSSSQHGLRSATFPPPFAEDEIRAMLDRDAANAEEDHQFVIQAGTDFGAAMDDDDSFGGNDLDADVSG